VAGLAAGRSLESVLTVGLRLDGWVDFAIPPLLMDSPWDLSLVGPGVSLGVQAEL
jgi:hypothetical protein